ncbi:hypothetical protein VFPFJ_03424 [Purpureocillium lilacinum]|uniref:Uncharacterized protein n=1 Tax=Purpureocillium lilacinum TaxID=33203 RepID=A0A179HNW1_PURLI|nr:hypothetical protein VFPFJ_03424 [Purpureocillium lilacinum]OAQ91684.1 hypothetical protein VFPFJ_03424 [Purpureocillium lilacinum]
MCLPNLFSRKQTQDHPHEETTPQPSPAQQPKGRRTAEATARLDKSRFSSTRRPRRGSSEKNQAGADYTPGGHAASSPSTGGPEGQHGGIYGGVQGGLYSGVSGGGGGANGGVSGGVYGGVYGTSGGGGLGTTPGGGYGALPGGT